MLKMQSLVSTFIIFVALSLLLGCGTPNDLAMNPQSGETGSAKPTTALSPTMTETVKQLPAAEMTASANAIALETFYAQGPTLTIVAATSAVEHATGLAAATLTREVANVTRTSAAATYVARETKIATTSASRSNITEEELLAAMALWSAQNIEDYEIEIDVFKPSSLSGQWRLRVQTSGDDEEIVAYEPIGATQIPAFEPSPSGHDMLQSSLSAYTIEYLFADMHGQAVLKDGRPPLGDWNVTFHPTMGYPTSIEYDFPRQGHYEWNWRVLNFRILKQQ